jgi:pilus assembly protein Flp/PilA
MTKALASVQTKLFFLRDEKGATAVEYGLMVALIAVVIIVAVAAVGTKLTNVFTNVSQSI